MGFLTLDKIDVDAGRREVDWEGIYGYKAHIASKPLWRRLTHAAF